MTIYSRYDGSHWVVEAAEPALPVLPAERPAPPELAQFVETVQRPVFRESRQPDAKAELSAEAANARPRERPLRALTLTAIVGAVGDKTAFFIDPATQEVLELRRGDTIDGWRLSEIDANQAILLRSDEERKFEVFALGQKRGGLDGIT